MFTIFSSSGIGNIVAGVFVLLISACFVFISIADIILLLKVILGKGKKTKKYYQMLLLYKISLLLKYLRI